MLNSSTDRVYLKLTFLPKHSNIFFPLSIESVILDTQNITFNSPNKLFLAMFWIKVVLPHPVCLIIKIFPSSFLL